MLKAVVFALALWITGVSLVGVLNPGGQSGIFRRLMTWTPWAGYAHIVGGSLALILGGIQLSSRLRRRNIGMHRIIGTLYVICVLIATVGAIATLHETTTGWPAKSGFWLLAIAWPTTTLLGYPWRGKFDVSWHGRLMIYSYAMTCAAITLRLYLIGLLASGVRFPYAYPTAAWAGGVGNVILAFVVMRIVRTPQSKIRDLSFAPVALSLLFVAVTWFAIDFARAPSNSPDADPRDFPHFDITTEAGTGTPGFSGDDGPALSAMIQRPTAVAMDSKGNLYIADEQNHRVRKVTPDGTITTVVGTGSTELQYRDLPGIETNLSAPYGIATDASDNLYVLNRGHNKIMKTGSDGIAKRIIGTGVAGFSGDGGPAVQAQINFTNHLAVDADGNIFLADTGNHRIRKVSASGIIETVAGTGQTGFSGDGGPAIEAQIFNPVAIAVDNAGNVFVADFSNHRIRKIQHSDQTITTIAGTGSPKYGGEGWPAIDSQIGEPCGVAVDQDGNVYIADQINCRVRVVTTSGLMYTVAGTGIQGHAGDGGPAEHALISNPDIIAFDSEGSLFIPDHQNAVIRKLTPIKR